MCSLTCGGERASALTYDVLVVGGGPSGAGGRVLARARPARVLVVEKKRFPREKTCGDGLTPRAVRQLDDMGLAEPLAEYHRFDGLRSIAHGITLELAWPEHPDFPTYGYVVRRRDLDEMVAEQAVKAGRRRCWQGTEAVAPDRRATASSPARSCKRQGHRRRPTRSGPATWSSPTAPTPGSAGRSAPPATARYPQGMAIRGYFTSPLPRRARGSRATSTSATATATSCPATAGSSRWATARSTSASACCRRSRGWKDVNTIPPHGRVRARPRPSYWGISPETAMRRADRRPAADGRLGRAPRSGPTWLVVGDAAGSINPFNGEGIDYAYETGRLAADAVDEALRDRRRAGARSATPQRLDDEYGLYFKVARTFVQRHRQPGAHARADPRRHAVSRTLMEWVLRIMANLLRPDELGPAEAAYRAVAAIVRVAPEP